MDWILISFYDGSITVEFMVLSMLRLLLIDLLFLGVVVIDCIVIYGCGCY